MYQLQKFFLQFLLHIKNNFKALSEKKYSDKKNDKQNNYFKGNAIADGARLEIKSDVSALKSEVEKISLKIVKKYFGNIDKTLQILQNKGVKVYKTKYAVKLLKNVNEKQGFLTPLRGFKAFYINFVFSFLCEHKLVFKTKSESMFIFSSSPIDTFFLASQIYRYVAFKKNMPGYEAEVQEKFKKIYKNPNYKNFSSLTAGEIFALKEAIARDVEAVDFAEKLHKEQSMADSLSKNNLKNK
ncbi:MAG: hypothetical protein ACI37T_03485, partial [Candidatus Gastranaerophilaceae bacterium]